MDKTLIKLYVMIAAAVLLIVLLAPVVLGHTAAWSADVWTRTELAAAGQGLPLPAEDCAVGKAIFVMDDGWETQYTVGYPLLSEYGMKGCIAVIPAAVSNTDYMTYQQLAEIYTGGWDMVNHTYNHEDLTRLNQDGQKAQISRGYRWLNEHGFKRGSDVLVFPGGLFNSDTTEEMKTLDFRAGRSLKSLWLVGKDCSLENVEVCNLISGMRFDAMRQTADKAMNNASTVIYVLHRIEPVTDTSGMQIEEKTLRRLLEYISKNNGELHVVTMTQFLDTL
jgi:peptidoglycan/xylan/chitin deacetylase (PgdA/CDA1 family)